MRLGDRVGVVGIRAAVVGYLGYLVAFGIGVDQRGREIVLDAEIILLVEGGKSSVSCPLKPSDSAPLKHSTMPP